MSRQTTLYPSCREFQWEALAVFGKPQHEQNDQQHLWRQMLGIELGYIDYHHSVAQIVMNYKSASDFLATNA